MPPIETPNNIPPEELFSEVNTQEKLDKDKALADLEIIQNARKEEAELKQEVQQQTA